MIVYETAGASSTWKEKARMERQATDAYEAPELRILGTLEDLTQATYQNLPKQQYRLP